AETTSSSIAHRKARVRNATNEPKHALRGVAGESATKRTEVRPVARHDEQRIWNVSKDVEEEPRPFVLIDPSHEQKHLRIGGQVERLPCCVASNHREISRINSVGKDLHARILRSHSG